MQHAVVAGKHFPQIEEILNTGEVDIILTAASLFDHLVGQSSFDQIFKGKCQFIVVAAVLQRHKDAQVCTLDQHLAHVDHAQQKCIGKVIKTCHIGRSIRRATVEGFVHVDADQTADCFHVFFCHIAVFDVVNILEILLCLNKGCLHCLDLADQHGIRTDVFVGNRRNRAYTVLDVFLRRKVLNPGIWILDIVCVQKVIQVAKHTSVCAILHCIHRACGKCLCVQRRRTQNDVLQTVVDV